MYILLLASGAGVEVKAVLLLLSSFLHMGLVY